MTTEDRVAHLELELAALRRLHRRTLAFAGIAVLVAVAVACTGSSIVESVKELRAQSIVLEDTDGKTLARLGVVKSGVELTFTDDKGRRRAVVGYTEEGSHLDLFDKDGNRRAVYRVDTRDGPTVNLLDGRGKAVWVAPTATP